MPSPENQAPNQDLSPPSPAIDPGLSDIEEANPTDPLLTDAERAQSIDITQPLSATQTLTLRKQSIKLVRSFAEACMRSKFDVPSAAIIHATANIIDMNMKLLSLYKANFLSNYFEGVVVNSASYALGQFISRDIVISVLNAYQAHQRGDNQKMLLVGVPNLIGAIHLGTGHRLIGGSLIMLGKVADTVFLAKEKIKSGHKSAEANAELNKQLTGNILLTLALAGIVTACFVKGDNMLAIEQVSNLAILAFGLLNAYYQPAVKVSLAEGNRANGLAINRTILAAATESLVISAAAQVFSQLPANVLAGPLREAVEPQELAKLLGFVAGASTSLIHMPEQQVVHSEPVVWEISPSSSLSGGHS